MEILFKNIDALVPLSAAAKKDLKRCLKVQHFSKKERVIEQGEISTKMYLIMKGVVRSFQYRNEKEVVTWLYYPEMYFAAWGSFLNQSKSDEVFECATDTALISIEYSDLQKLFKKHVSMESWGRKLMEHYTIYYNRFSQQMRFATAQEKYDFFLKNFPQQPKIKLGYVASFLGIRQETLSRLRKNS